MRRGRQRAATVATAAAVGVAAVDEVGERTLGRSRGVAAVRPVIVRRRVIVRRVLVVRGVRARRTVLAGPRRRRMTGPRTVVQAAHGRQRARPLERQQRDE